MTVIFSRSLILIVPTAVSSDPFGNCSCLNFEQFVFQILSDLTLVFFLKIVMQKAAESDPILS